jgi:transcriptional regulator
MSPPGLVGKWKVSQNRGEADRAGVAAGLQATGIAEASAMARLVKESSASPPRPA